MNRLITYLMLLASSIALISCMSTQEKGMSNYCLNFPENRASFFKYSSCMSEQRKAAVTTNTTNSSYSSSNDFYSKSLEQRLSDAERKNSQFQRDKLLRDSQEIFNRIDSEAKKTYDDRMKWKPGDK